MESKVYVPSYASQPTSVVVQAYPYKRALSSSSSAPTGSLPIRAPPTLDSDSDSESVGHKTFSTSSSSSSGGGYNGYESDERFLTGEEFESASERPLVAEPDEETLEESENFEPLRPFVAYPDRRSLESSIEDEEESGEYGPVVEPVLVDGPNLNRIMPKAQLSMDDDDDEVEEEIVGEVDEDSGFLGTVRVPGFEVLEKIDGSPRIKALGVDNNELVEWRDSITVKQSEPPLEVKVVEVDKVVEAQNGVLGVGMEKALVVERPGEDTASAEVSQDMGLGAAEVANVESLIANGEYVMEKNGKLDEDAKHSGEEKGVDKEEIELNAADGGQREIVGLNEDGGVTMKSSNQRESVADAEEANEVMEETSITINESDVLSSDTEDCIHSNLCKGNRVVTQLEKQSVRNGFAATMESNLLESSPEVEESFKYVAKEPMFSQNSESSRLDVSGSFDLDNGSHSEKIESKLQPGIDLGVGFHDATASTQVESLSDGPEGNELTHSNSSESVILSSNVAYELKQVKKDEANIDPDTIKGVLEGNRGSLPDEDAQGLILGSSETAKTLMHEFEQRLISSDKEVQGLQDRSRVGEQIVIDSDEEVDEDRDGERKQLFNSVPLEASLKAVTGANSEEHSTCLDSLFHSPRPAPRLNCPSPIAGGEFEDNLSEEEKKKIEKIQLLRVKFLRLVQRLHISTEDFRVSKVLYRFVLDAMRYSSQTFSLESTAKRLAMQLEAEGKDDLDFSLNVLVLGKTGVGKSATINSIFGEKKAMVGAFEPTTTTVKEIVGTIHGIKIRFLDTPGFRSSVMEQSINWKILASIKKFLRKFPPDIVLYVDRFDTTQNRELIDFPLLKSITSSLGSSIWLNAVVTLTHAASDLPDGQSGSPLGYDKFVCEQSNVIQKSINEAVGDLQLMNRSCMCPLYLVENHPLCQKNSSGERVLPNGLIWRPHLLLMFYSIKFLSEATAILLPQNTVDYQKLFRFGLFPPPTYFLASLLQPHAHPKLSGDQGGDDVDSDTELLNLSVSEEEDEDEYDQLPPFMPLRKSHIAELSKEQRKAYFEEYDYRVKLLQKKQLKQLKRLREIKKKGKNGGNNYVSMEEDEDQEDGNPVDVPAPLPDMVLPPSFDADHPTFRYRLLEPASDQLLVRPIPSTEGWDHDLGYDAIMLETKLVIAGKFPAGFGFQIMKDKKEFSMYLDSSVAAKHGENESTMASFSIQTIGEQLAYILRGETKVKYFNINKTTARVAVTFLDGNVATGLKFENQIAVGKRLVLVGSTGVVGSQDETALGANLEVRLKDEDFPLGQDQSTFGISLVKARGDMSLLANLHSQFSVGQSSKMAIRVGMNDKRSGQITVRTSSSEQLHIALFGILPIAVSIFRSICPGFSVKN
jgi:Toc86/159 family protein import component